MSIFYRLWEHGSSRQMKPTVSMCVWELYRGMAIISGPSSAVISYFVIFNIPHPPTLFFFLRQSAPLWLRLACFSLPGAGIIVACTTIYTLGYNLSSFEDSFNVLLSIFTSFKICFLWVRRHCLGILRQTPMTHVALCTWQFLSAFV